MLVTLTIIYRNNIYIIGYNAYHKSMLSLLKTQYKLTGNKECLVNIGKEIYLVSDYKDIAYVDALFDSNDFATIAEKDNIDYCIYDECDVLLNDNRVDDFITFYEKYSKYYKDFNLRMSPFIYFFDNMPMEKNENDESWAISQLELIINSTNDKKILFRAYLSETHIYGAMNKVLESQVAFQKSKDVFKELTGKDYPTGNSNSKP